MSDLGRWLDELDAAREKATPGPWEQDVYEILAPRHRLVVETGWRPDAALIVAAVNALPRLTAALRAVEALAEELEGEAEGERATFPTSVTAKSSAGAKIGAARRLRAALDGSR